MADNFMYSPQATSRSTIDKMEKFYKDLTVFALEHISQSVFCKLFLKSLCYSNIGISMRYSLAMLEEDR